jgi:GT2 family glycosyltransferase
MRAGSFRRRRVKLSLVAVSYFSSRVLPRCLRSFREEAATLGADAEVVVVEHSEDADEAAAIRDCGVDQVLELPNRGYAAGLNAGAEASNGDLLLLANPDIEFLPGSLRPLVDAATGGFAVAGPQLVWDGDARLLLPLPDVPSAGAEIGRSLRRRWPWAWRWGLQADLERYWRLWRSVTPTSVPCLRGPLLVVGRDQWQRLGRMDEGYFLYYEETEWLWRAHRQGAALALVGNARVVHRWGHATRRSEHHQRIDEQSRQRFFARNYSPFQRRLMQWLASGPATGGPRPTPVSSPDQVPAMAAELWLLSPFSHLIPSAGWLGDDGMPPELPELTAEGRWYLGAAARRGRSWRLLASWTWGTP